MHLRTAWLTDQGPRKQNEDAVGVWEISDDWIVAAVADGLGGHFGGRQASTIALEALGHAIQGTSALDLAQIAAVAHQAIRIEQAETSQLRSMATTLSAIEIHGQSARIVHCGDSRIALARGDGIVRLTEDHTEAQRLLSEGLLTQEQFKTYPRKNVLHSALGIHGDPRIDVRGLDIQAGDRIFLTSDGTHEKIALQELMSLARLCPTPSELCSAARERVLERGPTDNFSLVALYAD